MAHITITSDAHLLSSAPSNPSRVTASDQSIDEAVNTRSMTNFQTSDTTPLNNQSTFTILRGVGDPYQLYQTSPDLMAKAKTLAERMDGPLHPSNQDHFFYQGSMRDFLRAGVLTDSSFLDMANSLSDQALNDLADTLQAMVLPASNNFTSHAESDRTFTEKVAQFIDTLEQVSPEQREQILSQAASYAKQVDQQHLSTFNAIVYGQDISRFNTLQRFTDDTSANNLHNYVSAIISSDTPADLTAQLNTLSNEAQQGLLNVYGLDTELGACLSQLISRGEPKVPESLLTALGDMVDAIHISPFINEDFGFAYTGVEALLKDNEQSSGRKFALDSVTSMIAMMENYDLSDDQLETMGTELSALSNPQKRAYIEITTTGLDTMLQATVMPNLDKKNLTQALDIVSTLRNNEHVLELVNRSRYHDVTLIERPDIEEGLTVVALEGAAVFQNPATAFSQSRMLIGATPDKVQMKNGHSIKGNESENLYSAKSFDTYEEDVSNLVKTLVSFEVMRQDSTASQKMSLNEFTHDLTEMHSGIRDELMRKVSDEVTSNSFRSKVTDHTQLAFFANVLEQMKFEVLKESPY